MRPSPVASRMRSVVPVVEYDATETRLAAPSLSTPPVNPTLAAGDAPCATVEWPHGCPSVCVAHRLAVLADVVLTVVPQFPVARDKEMGFEPPVDSACDASLA